MNREELLKIKQKALEDHIPIIMDDTLEVINKILDENKLDTILEIGTAVGYSAICFSDYFKGYLCSNYLKIKEGFPCAALQLRLDWSY